VIDVRREVRGIEHLEHTRHEENAAHKEPQH
jgi:hypothetical protein